MLVGVGAATNLQRIPGLLNVGTRLRCPYGEAHDRHLLLEDRHKVILAARSCDRSRSSPPPNNPDKKLPCGCHKPPSSPETARFRGL